MSAPFVSGQNQLYEHEYLAFDFLLHTLTAKAYICHTFFLQNDWGRVNVCPYGSTQIAYG
jgi:hypothetical protein